MRKSGVRPFGDTEKGDIVGSIDLHETEIYRYLVLYWAYNTRSDKFAISQSGYALGALTAMAGFVWGFQIDEFYSEWSEKLGLPSNTTGLPYDEEIATKAWLELCKKYNTAAITRPPEARLLNKLDENTE